MATKTSTAPDYLDALFTALAARPGLAGVQVQQTWPGQATRAEAIYSGEIDTDMEIPVSAGARLVRQEDYTVEVIIDCTCAGNSWIPARNAAFAYLGEVDDQVASTTIEVTPTSTAAQIKAKVIKHKGTPYQDPNREGWGWMLKVSIAVTARLK
jgi:hypothetical protein